MGGGLLSGKFTRSAPTTPTRLSASDVGERDLEIARTVDAVADEAGASSSQVALAWLVADRPWLHPVVGARRLEQLTDNLGAVDLRLTEDAIRRLDRASAIELGFPADFIASMGEFVYGPVGERVDFVNRA